MIKEIKFYSNEKDYLDFEVFLKNKNIEFIDRSPTMENKVKIIESFKLSERSEIILLNKDIFTLEEYENNFTINSGYYHFHPIGKGIIQVLKSSIIRNNLMFGKITFNFEDDDKDSIIWGKNVIKWIKDNGKKVYRTSSNMRIIAEKSENNFFCLPNASLEYNGINGKFLRLVEGVSCISK
jgi:hypothetical protein